MCPVISAYMHGYEYHIGSYLFLATVHDVNTQFMSFGPARRVQFILKIGSDVDIEAKNPPHVLVLGIGHFGYPPGQGP
jgi:methylthioribose-1-phosphate isomerase